MKRLIRIVVIPVMFSIVASSSASAQDLTEKARREYAKGLLGEDLVADTTYNLKLRDAGRLHSLPGTVFVIPTVQMKLEDIAALTEDLNIMARIIDKKLNRRHFPDMFHFVDPTAHRGLYDAFFSSGDNGPTKAMYVQGYGAVFLFSVDFPLAPAPELKVEKPEDPIDPLWEQTKQEMFSDKHADDALNYQLKYYDRRESATAELAYDPDKVDDLTRKLISVLKHAANIRSLKPDESVVLSIAGARQPVVIKQILSQKQGSSQPESGVVLSTAPSSSMVMTISVKKSDIDLFAKDELSLEEFRQKTQTLTCPHVSGKANNALIHLDTGYLDTRF